MARPGRYLLAGMLLAAGSAPFPTAAQSPSDGVEVGATVEYYEISAPTIDHVVAALNQMRLEGPDGPPSQGLTRYYIEPDWTARAGGGACRVDRVDVRVDVAILLPRWVELDDRPVLEQARWNTIQTAIREHEFEHRDLAIDAAHELRTELADLEARGCGTLRSVVSSAMSIADERLREAHAELDRTTPRRLQIGPG
jgi:predicted secreted Zn-dependent protease